MVSDIKERIIAWLADEGVEVKTAPVPPGAPIEWNLLATIQAPLPVKVNIQKKSGMPKLAFIMGVAFSKEHLELIMSLDPPERRGLIAGIIKDLLLLCPDCVVVTRPPNIEQASSIIVTREILADDERLRSEVSRTLRILANSFMYVILTLTARFGPAPRRGSGRGLSVM